MKTFLFPAQRKPLPPALFQGVVLSKAATRTCGPGATSAMWPRRRRLVVDLSATKMDDGGMYAWAAILTVVGLLASYGIAVAWQRWKDRNKERA